MNRNDLSLCLFSISLVFVTSSVAHEAIINGKTAGTHQFPYQVSVQHHGKRHVCGGGIIGDQFILTAAHCVFRQNGHYRQSITILAGTNDLSINSTTAVKVEVRKIYMPMEYRPPSIHSTGDIAVLKLSQSLDLSHFWSSQKILKRLKLPKNNNDYYLGTKARIAGFGWDWIEVNGNNENGGRNATYLRYASATVISNSKCQEGYWGREITDRHLCAAIKDDSPSARGACTGDSGGPLVEDGTVIGILSTSPLGCRETVQAAVYTRVSAYLDFIKEAMKDEQRPDIRTHELIPNSYDSLKVNILAF